MRKKMILMIFIFVLCLTGILGCIHKEKTEYRHMIYVNHTLYGESASTVTTLPSGYVKVGSVEYKVSNTEPMVEKNFYSNHVEVGTSIYANRKQPQEIYVPLNKDSFIKYTLIEELE